MYLAKCICLNCKMYTVQIDEFICPHYKLYLPKLNFIYVKVQNVVVKIAKFRRMISI